MLEFSYFPCLYKKESYKWCQPSRLIAPEQKQTAIDCCFSFIMSRNSDATIALTKSFSVTNKPSGRSATLRCAFTCGVVVSATAAVLLILYGTFGTLLSGYETPDINGVVGNETITAENDNAVSEGTQDLQTASNQPKPCPHVLLFSAVRHGSTWFVDNVERCAYSRDASGNRTGFFGKLNQNAELWLKAQPGPLKSMPVNEVPNYVFNNHSTKIFPFIWSSRLDDVRHILHAVSGFVPPVPIVLLTRDEQSVYQSWLTAKETEVWNADTNGTKRALNSSIWDSPEQIQKAQSYADRLKKYFADVAVYLSRNGYVFDQLDYDRIVQMRSIPLQNSACVIHNCNFAAFPTLSE